MLHKIGALDTVRRLSGRYRLLPHFEDVAERKLFEATNPIELVPPRFSPRGTKLDHLFGKFSKFFFVL